MKKILIINILIFIITIICASVNFAINKSTDISNFFYGMALGIQWSNIVFITHDLFKQKKK